MFEGAESGNQGFFGHSINHPDPKWLAKYINDLGIKLSFSGLDMQNVGRSSFFNLTFQLLIELSNEKCSADISRIFEWVEGKFAEACLALPCPVLPRLAFLRSFWNGCLRIKKKDFKLNFEEQKKLHCALTLYRLLITATHLPGIYPLPDHILPCECVGALKTFKSQK